MMYVLRVSVLSSQRDVKHGLREAAAMSTYHVYLSA